MERNTISRDEIIMADIVIPCKWNISSTGRSITALCTDTKDGSRFKIVFTGDMGEYFTAARAAARDGITTQVNGEGLMLIMGNAIPLKAPAPRVYRPEKERQGEVKEKWFIGQTLTGPSWTISFDGAYGKTRVIFKHKPAPAVLQAVKDAGFYWSPSMKSWNKGLNFKAYRAAEKLHSTLYALTA